MKREANMTFGAHLTEAMQRRAMHPVQLTAALLERGVSVTPTTVYNWAQGETEPRASTILEICRVLDLDPNNLMGWGDD